MTEGKWTKKRAHEELDNQDNWEITYQSQFIREKQFEFYSLRLVKYELWIAKSDWEQRTSLTNIPLIGEWADPRILYVRTRLDNGQYALKEISRSDAVDWMMEAVDIELNPK